KPSIDEVIPAFQEATVESGHVPTVAYYGLSDLDNSSLQAFEPVWNKLSSEYKRKIITELAEASEDNFDFNYESLGYLALDDSDGGVRSAAIDLMWINESLSLMSRLVDLAENDASSELAARATSELGRFILLGEYEEIPETESVRVQDVVINLLNDAAED